MAAEEFNALDLLNTIIREKGSWIYDEVFYKPNLKTFFDPFSEEFKNTPALEKILELKELFYCGVEPILLNTIYKKFCKDEHYEELLEDFGYSLLELIKSVSEEDLSNLDIHEPANWYKGNEDNLQTVEVHTAVEGTLEMMSEETHKQLIKQTNLFVRKRLTFLSYSLNNPKVKLIRNYDPVFDKIDDELLKHVESYETDIKARAWTIQKLAEQTRDML